MILILIQIIQISNSCSNFNWGICLIENYGQSFVINNNNNQGYSFGFWSQYLSMSQQFDINDKWFPNCTNYALFIGKDLQQDDIKLLYYQKPDTDYFRIIVLLIQQNNVMQEIMYLMFDVWDYEGMWIYHYFAFSAPNILQVIIYKSEVVYFIENFEIDISVAQNINLIFGGDTKFMEGDSNIQIAQFLGRLSEPEISEPGTIFQSEKLFINYFYQKSQPTADCQFAIQETNKLEDYQYQQGLIVMESWIKLYY